MKVGDRVRVQKSIMVYHNPKSRNKPFDVQGLEGEVVALVNEWQGKSISANLPLQVQFEKKFKAHFREDELELLS